MECNRPGRKIKAKNENERNGQKLAARLVGKILSGPEMGNVGN